MVRARSVTRAHSFLIFVSRTLYFGIVEDKLKENGLDCAHIPFFTKDDSVVWPHIRYHTDSSGVFMDGVDL